MYSKVWIGQLYIPKISKEGNMFGNPLKDLREPLKKEGWEILMKNVFKEGSSAGRSPISAI
jgi:hypothetical protein